MALVPPLGVIGIGIAIGDQSVWVGATLLFATNLAGTIFSGTLIFLWQEYGSLQRARNAIMLSGAVILAIGVPLAFSLNTLLIQSNTRQQVRYILLEESELFEGVRLSSIRVKRRDAMLVVSVELIANPDVVSEAQARSAQVRLMQALKRPVELSVQVIPVREFLIPAEVE